MEREEDKGKNGHVRGGKLPRVMRRCTPSEIHGLVSVSVGKRKAKSRSITMDRPKTVGGVALDEVGGGGGVVAKQSPWSVPPFSPYLLDGSEIVAQVIVTAWPPARSFSRRVANAGRGNETAGFVRKITPCQRLLFAAVNSARARVCGMIAKK